MAGGIGKGRLCGFFRFALQVVQNLHHLAAGQAAVGLECCGADPRHNTMLHHIVHGFMVPGAQLHVCQVCGGAQLAAGAAEGDGDSHALAGLGEAPGAVAVFREFHLAAVGPGDCDLSHFIALVGLGGDGHWIALAGMGGIDGHGAVLGFEDGGGIGRFPAAATAAPGQMQMVRLFPHGHRDGAAAGGDGDLDASHAGALLFSVYCDLFAAAEDHGRGSGGIALQGVGVFIEFIRIFRNKVAQIHVDVGELKLGLCASRGNIQQDHIGALLLEVHGDLLVLLAGELCVLCDCLGIQSVAVLVQQESHQGAVTRLVLEGVVLQGHGGGGRIIAVVQDHIQRGHFPCAGIGAREQDGRLIVAAVVLGQAFGFGLRANRPLCPGVGVQVHAAFRDLLLAEGVFHITAHVVGQHQGVAACVDAGQVIVGDGNGIAVIAVIGHAGFFLQHAVGVEAHLDRPAAVCQRGVGGVVEGDSDGALALVFLQHLHLGDADIRVVQIGGAALVNNLPSGCVSSDTVSGDGVLHIAHSLVNPVVHRQGGALIGGKGLLQSGGLLFFQGDGQVRHLVHAGVADGELDGGQALRHQVGVVHPDGLHLQAVGLEVVGGGVELGLLAGEGDGGFGLFVVDFIRVSLVIVGGLDHRLDGMLGFDGIPPFSHIGVEVVQQGVFRQLRHHLGRSQPEVIHNVVVIRILRQQADRLQLAVGRCHPAVICDLVADGLAPQDGQVLQRADGNNTLPVKGEAEVAADIGLAAAGEGGEGGREGVGHDAILIHRQQLDVADAVPLAVPSQDEAHRGIRSITQRASRHLGVLVQGIIAGDQHGSAQVAIFVHDGVTDLLAGAVRRSGAV